MNWFKSFFKEKIEHKGIFGITQHDIDNHAPSDSVFVHKEIVASVSMPTFNGVRNDGTIRKFPYQFQDGSSACVAFSTAKIATILYYLLTGRIVKWSPGFWYTRRSNKPGEGMNFADIASLSTDGCVTNEILPSEGLGETDMNNLDITEYLKESADGFSMPANWIEVPLDFDTVASTIEQTKKGLMAWFSFGPGEWFYTSYPKIVGDKPWNHSVVLIDTTTINGNQYLVVHCSADNEDTYVKYISRDFFKRCYLVRYPTNFKFATTDKPKFDGSVKSMQECLIYEKLLASGLNTGYLGQLTKAALVKFQVKYSISPAVGFFGDLTKAKLYQLYS